MDERPLPAAFILRVFTHPACAGCPRAVRLAWEASRERPGVEVRTVSLEHPDGLAAARAAGIRTLPSVILESPRGEITRWVGTPEPGALVAALDALRESA